MKHAHANVIAFMKLAGQTVRDIPTKLDFESAIETDAVGGVIEQMRTACTKLKDHGRSEPALRARLMLEELAETLDAMLKQDLVAVADGLVDLDYVTIGTAVAYGLPHAAVWDEVQRANMGKAHVVDGQLVMVRDAGGKVQKPADWKEPQVFRALRDAENAHYRAQSKAYWDDVKAEVDAGRFELIHVLPAFTVPPASGEHGDWITGVDRALIRLTHKMSAKTGNPKLLSLAGRARLYALLGITDDTPRLEGEKFGEDLPPHVLPFAWQLRQGKFKIDGLVPRGWTVDHEMFPVNRDETADRVLVTFTDPAFTSRSFDRPDRQRQVVISNNSPLYPFLHVDENTPRAAFAQEPCLTIPESAPQPKGTKPVHVETEDGPHD